MFTACQQSSSMLLRCMSAVQFYVITVHVYTAVDDDSYLESGVDRAQYVLDDVGTIWRGTAGQPQPMKWEYGQVSTIIT